MALPSPDYRGKHIYFFTRQSLKNRFDNLIGRLPCYRLSAIIAVGSSKPCIQKPKVIINFRYCSTVERGLPEADFCSIDIAGLNPSIRSHRASQAYPGIAWHTRIMTQYIFSALRHKLYQRLMKIYPIRKAGNYCE